MRVRHRSRSTFAAALLLFAASLGMVLNALLTDPLHTGVTLLIILLGVPVYFLWSLAARN